MKTEVLHLGQTYQFELEVRSDMQAAFDDHVVHELYGSAAMLTHMEWASRQLLLPALEAHEEGVGYDMHIQHLAPTPIGEVVIVSATITGIRPGPNQRYFLTTECQAHHGQRLVGQGTVVQAILPLTCLHDKLPKESVLVN